MKLTLERVFFRHGKPEGEITEDDIIYKRMELHERKRIQLHGRKANRGGSDSMKDRDIDPVRRHELCYEQNVRGMLGEATFCKWFTGSIEIWDADCNARDESRDKGDHGYDFPARYHAPIQIKCRPNYWDATYLPDWPRYIKKGFYYVLTICTQHWAWKEGIIVGWATSEELEASPIDKYLRGGQALPVSKLHPMRTFPFWYEPITDRVMKIPGG